MSAFPGAAIPSVELRVLIRFNAAQCVVDIHNAEICL
jgi:hypothetical protein